MKVRVFMTITLTFVLTSHPCKEAESWLRDSDSTRGEGSEGCFPPVTSYPPPSHITQPGSANGSMQNLWYDYRSMLNRTYSQICCHLWDFSGNGKHWISSKIMPLDLMPPSGMNWKLFTYIRKWEQISFHHRQQPKSHFTSHLLRRRLQRCRSTCVARAGLWKTDGGLGAQVAPARELPNQPRVRESATPTKKTPIDILPKAGTYTERDGGCLMAQGTETFGGCFLWVVPLCWLLLSCVESAISVLGRVGGVPGWRD